MTGLPEERIAGAPISWGVCEAPGWGHQLDRDRVLGEMRELGLAATENGPDGFLPEDPEDLRECLARYGMTLVGGWFTPLVLHGQTERWRPRLEAVVRRYAANGAEVAVLAAATGLDDYDSRPELSRDDWGRALRALDAATELAAEHGVRLVLHPHVGTLVESAEEIDRILEGSTVPFCLDTGHIILGGGDPVAIAERAPERIGHLHLKDVDAGLAARFRAGDLSFSDAVQAGVFCTLGDGDLDIGAVVETLYASGYRGWWVFEQDVMLRGEPPPGRGPREEVSRSLGFLRRALAGAAT